MPAREILQDILSNGGLTVLFQPLVSMVTREVYGYEALIRGPSGTLLNQPAELFDAARKYNALAAIEDHCIIAAAKSFAAQKLPGKLFINITPDTLIGVDKIADRMSLIAEKLQIDPTKIVIELNERYAAANEKDLSLAIARLRRQGFTIAINNMGSGFNGTENTAVFAADYIKISRDVIANIHSVTLKQEIVNAIVGIASSRGAQVIAEGVESKSEMEALSQLGVKIIQGYWIARPSEKPEVAGLGDDLPKLEQHNSKQFVHEVLAIAPDDQIRHVQTRFKDDATMKAMVVVDDSIPVGIVLRQTAMEIRDKRKLFQKDKTVAEIMISDFVKVESTLGVKQIGRALISNKAVPEPVFVVTRQEKYVGIGYLEDIFTMLVRSA